MMHKELIKKKWNKFHKNNKYQTINKVEHRKLKDSFTEIRKY